MSDLAGLASGDMPGQTVLAWGPNSYGQLANGNTEDVLVPTEFLGFPANVRSVLGGGGHTFVTTEQNELFACGWNTKGQLGIPDIKDSEVKRLHIVSFFKVHKIASIAAGWDFSLACTDKGDLYAWGSNSFGQLGCSEVKGSTSSPAKVKIPGQVIVVSAGLRHSMALTVDGELYSWGSGKKGQLGVLLEATIPSKLLEPTRVTLPGEDTGVIVQIVCGAYHSAVLKDTGHVYVWGDNKHGQMALPVSEVKIVSLPRLVSPLVFPSKVVTLCSGWTHLVILTEQDELLSWGRNHYGQLGRDTQGQGHDPNPKVISLGVKPVSQVICGSEHNMVLAGGRLYTWGWNEHGICATGDEINVPEPRQVALLNRFDIALLGSGDGHSFTIGFKR